jgi:hypothetical protein
MKLLEKTRIGSKVYKKYDTPKTPRQRILDSSHVSDKDKEKLRKIYASLTITLLSLEEKSPICSKSSFR